MDSNINTLTLQTFLRKIAHQEEDIRKFVQKRRQLNT